ncbi:hypothetical protein CXB49_21310 [Chromobacterium sp. ATCC 53434]|uniref:tetratricopeptide repeat protein n=1 Tax=Chromobacterium sp. (strain ATCC 53434 / SC 14030) TaxID=2059672 RepID=UPI000C78A408|nr:tetratricopeptide repeat protein [Chromobacterium sp. ATCC 53434]AUH53147.1 hypothetical protein CXB49_21310 [Chromobacterium sp. ATCC 53434]
MTAAPTAWDAGAHASWQAGKPQEAIALTLAAVNRHGHRKPVDLVLQLAYYLFLAGQYHAAAQALAQVRPDYPDNREVLLNLGISLARSQQCEQAIPTLQAYLAHDPGDALVHATLCTCFHRLGRLQEAADAGARSLALSDSQHGEAPVGWRLPDTDPAAFALGKTQVIAFSLWGGNPRYLRGAIDNALAAPHVYPGWRARFYLDETVPEEVRRELAALGCELVLEAPGQSLRQRLTWRFQAANDPRVGRFLVRDADSVIGPREKLAVDEWLASGRWFHVMRDWWTHTDLILAGMWGGVAGALPPLDTLLAGYRSAHMETPNVDQWFLRDKVWSHVRLSCMVHDRCFASHAARPWPGPQPEGNGHVGQDAFASQRVRQEKRLAAWISKLPSLALG